MQSKPIVVADSPCIKNKYKWKDECASAINAYLIVNQSTFSQLVENNL